MDRLGPADFDGNMLRRPGTFAVAFLAQWCGFCHDFEPRFRALEPVEGAHFAFADISDQENPLWERFAIEVVPTVIGFVDGSLRWRRDGVLGEGLASPDLTAIRQAVESGRPETPGR